MTETPAKPHSHRRQWLILGVLVLILAVVIAAWCGYTWHRLNHARLPAAAGTTFIVKKGESLAALSHDLAGRSVLAHAWDLQVLARLRSESSRVQAGEYRVPAGATTETLLEMMVAGRVVMHAFTIVPGETFQSVLASLESNPAFTHDLKGLSFTAVMARLGHSSERPEGRFFPQTYDFPRGTPTSKVLARAYAAMRDYLSAAWKGRAPDLVLESPYQALIIASIVEKETAVPAERPRIAGVFERRIKRGMALGADPTVIYGLGDAYHGKLTRQDMKQDTPYNTYLHRGLPPTPICMPGKAAINAALHPAQGTALYFVAKGDGTHVFSDTLAGQERMIRKYQLHRPPVQSPPKGSSGP
ncbi:MAG: endolytic transglycosylase MltG [Gammaproteobacteria bacterium]